MFFLPPGKYNIVQVRTGHLLLQSFTSRAIAHQEKGDVIAIGLFEFRRGTQYDVERAGPSVNNAYPPNGCFGTLSSNSNFSFLISSFFTLISVFLIPVIASTTAGNATAIAKTATKVSPKRTVLVIGTSPKYGEFELILISYFFCIIIKLHYKKIHCKKKDQTFKTKNMTKTVPRSDRNY